MTRRERNLLLTGLLIGALVVTFFVIGREYMSSRGEPKAAAATPVENPPSASEATATPDSAATVQLSEQEQKSIGVETSEVKRQTIHKEIAAPGKVTEPETGIGTISARIGGRIEKLLINVTGETVTRGQPVALIYSPEVFTAGEEYRLALDNRRRLSDSKESEAVRDADELVRASRRRLELWGVSAQQIEEIASAADKAVQITTYSPISGIITKRNVAEGQYVKEGDVLFELADLSTVWVQADIFESDVSLIHLGQKVRVFSAHAKERRHSRYR
jgi:Cu(I)/Ag(I) efflux system membrane fusion protein